MKETGKKNYFKIKQQKTIVIQRVSKKEEINEIGKGELIH